MISNEEFRIMVDELLVQNPPCYDMLSHIAQKNLKSWVRTWCSRNPVLQGRGYEDDVLQEIQLKLIKVTIASYFLKKDAAENVRYDPLSFEKWMMTVGRNQTVECAKYISVRDKEKGEIDENTPDDSSESEAAEERIELLKRSFALTISSRKRVYIILTWIAGALFMLNLDVSKIKAIDTLDRTFAKKTLFEMRDMIVAAAEWIPWLELTHEQHDMISEALNEHSDDGRVFGEITYSEFYMKKGGKATISDWINRMNNYIIRRLIDEASEH